MRKRWYIGCVMDYTTSDYHYKAFTSADEPTPETHPYLYVVGPFVTKRGALWAERYGKRNPHFTGVWDAERLSRAES